MTEDLSKLKKLGSTLEKIPNKFPEADFPVEFKTSELTSLCPFTGHPDFYRLKVRYKPGKFVVELKSVKLYIEKFRYLRTTHETLLNIIFEDLKSLLSPRYLFVELKVNVRGGIRTTLSREESF
ncbi:preQ(1) synthase [candidate division WOR-3 bacterium]|nr:preQ(1) synthase [candidate division WOR-3 bacterium]